MEQRIIRRTAKAMFLAAVLLTTCLIASSARAQSAKAASPNSGINSFLESSGATPGCGYMERKGPAAPVRPQQGPSQDNDTSRRPSLVLISAHAGLDSDTPSDHANIVGLWKFTFTAEGNGSSGPTDGTPVDAGYVTWHSDGTELMNSGRAPTTGSFCMGVWKQIAPSTYQLNHVALSWAFDADAPVTGAGTGGADFVGPANIREVVVVDRSGNKYEGTFTLIQYAPDETTVLGGVKGRVTATRVTVD